MSRAAAVAVAYGWSCVTGAAAMMLWDTQPGVGLSAQMMADALADGLTGGLLALPIVLTLIAVAERWRWRNPLIYLPMVPVICLAIAVGAVVFLPEARFGAIASDETSLVVYAPSAALPVAVLISVATYWALRGRMSGALS